MTRRARLLWTPIIVSPLAWFTAMLINFALTPLPCNGSAPLARAAVWIGALVVTAAAGMLGWSLRRENTGEHAAQGAAAHRVRAMALAGAVLSASFFLVIIAQAMPDLLLAGCQ